MPHPYNSGSPVIQSHALGAKPAGHAAGETRAGTAALRVEHKGTPAGRSDRLSLAAGSLPRIRAGPNPAAGGRLRHLHPISAHSYTPVPQSWGHERRG